MIKIQLKRGDDMLQIKKNSVSNLVSERILQLIISKYRSGDKLPSESELEEVLGVGRASIREGLKRLEALGLVETQHGRGTFVRTPKVSLLLEPLLVGGILPIKKELADLFEVRKVLETEASRLAALNATHQHIRKIGDCLEQMKRVIDKPLEFIETDLEYHVTIGEASGNLVLPIILKVVRNLFIRNSENVAMIPNITTISLKHHEAIYTAIKNGQSVEAQRRMGDHLEESKSGWIELNLEKEEDKETI